MKTRNYNISKRCRVILLSWWTFLLITQSGCSRASTDNLWSTRLTKFTKTQEYLLLRNLIKYEKPLVSSPVSTNEATDIASSPAHNISSKLVNTGNQRYARFTENIHKNAGSDQRSNTVTNSNITDTKTIVNQREPNRYKEAADYSGEVEDYSDSVGKFEDYRSSSNKNSELKQDNEEEQGIFSSIARNVEKRFQRALGVLQEVSDAFMEVPRQILMLPIRLGYYPGLQREQEQIPKLVSFPCKIRHRGSSSSSVHRLRPEDIRVVAALGDSLTSANAAMAYTEEETHLNYRGVSATGGGRADWRKFLTVPNILKEFNPLLRGYAVAPVETSSPLAGFNVAENGALDDELLRQAKLLVYKMKEDSRVDIQKHWKLINILIGGNDICNEYCYVDNDKDSPAGHKLQLEIALQYLQKELPKTFVNLIHIPNLLVLHNLENVPFVCYVKQRILCSCLFGGAERVKAESVARMLQGYWDIERQVAEDPRFDTDNFTVVLQPFFLGVDTPDEVHTWFGDAPDLSYFAPDCFHFSQKGNALMANALWNNMLEPVGNKTQGWHPLMTRFLCPSEEAPYLFTRRNSRAAR